MYQYSLGQWNWVAERHWLNFIKTNGAAPRAAKSALQRSRLYWQLHQLWKSFELHERSKLDELASAVMTELVSRRSRCRSNCTWPFGWVSQWSYLNARLRVLWSILQIVSVVKLTFWRVFWKAKPSSFVLVQKASFLAKNWQSYEKKKIGEANQRQRWDQPRQRWDQCNFLYIRRFSIFPGMVPNLFWVRECDGETWKKKRKTKGKKDCGQRQREKISLIFRRASSLEKEGDDCLHLCEEFLMQSTSLFMCSQICLCVIERTIGVWTSVKVLYHERERENGPLFQFTWSFAWRCSFGLLNGDRPIDAVGRPTIFVFHFGRAQIRGASHWGGKSAYMAFFFLVWEQFLSVEVIEEERKESKGQSSSLRWIEESRKKSHRALEYTRTWVRSIKRRAAPAARSTGRRPPRDRGCEMTFETEAWNRRVLISIFYHILTSVFSLFRWEPCTTLNAHSTLAYSQHQHQATSWWHDDVLVRCSHAQQQPFQTLRSSKNEPQQRENERKDTTMNTNACGPFPGWLLPTLHGFFFAPEFTDRMSDVDEPMS